jgi:hypothetical protein
MPVVTTTLNGSRRSTIVVAGHWVMTMQDRKQGWLVPIFYDKFREILTHTAFRFALCCPIYAAEAVALQTALPTPDQQRWRKVKNRKSAGQPPPHCVFQDKEARAQRLE